MNLLDPSASPALVAAVVLLLSLLGLRWHQRKGPRRTAHAPRDALDTVQAWPPTLSRVLSIHERQAYDHLRRALPGFMVLAQVPLSRFLRVPTRQSYGDWLHRVGNQSADLLLCDAGSRVLAIIDIRSPQETERSRRRHERLSRVLKAAGIRVYTWYEGDLPTVAEIRSLVGAELAPASAAPKGLPTSRPMPLIPVAEIEEVLADGDQMAYDAGMEPVPSGFYDEPDSVRGALGAR